MSYKSVVDYYDDIFPLNPVTLQFLSQSFQSSFPLLDLACACGAYTIGLAKKGYVMHGCDLDDEMIARAKEKLSVENVSPSFTVADMTDLLSHYPCGLFGGLFCIGNSLAHLADQQQLLQVCRQFYALLRDDGRIVLQIINYDRVVSQKLNGLPSIENQARGLRFERHYDVDFPKVKFTARLLVDGKTETAVNHLYAITYNELTSCLQEAGFRDLEPFGSFTPSDFDINTSQPLILRARK